LTGFQESESFKQKEKIMTHSSLKEKNNSTAGNYTELGALFFGLLLCCYCQAEPQKITVRNAAISVTLDANDATLLVTDKRTDQSWRQKAVTPVQVIQSTKVENGVDMTSKDAGLGINIQTKLRLDGDKPEFTIELSAQGHLKYYIPRMPHHFGLVPNVPCRHHSRPHP
jgi:hypothetical protein